MFMWMIVLVMLVFPAASILIELHGVRTAEGIFHLTGKWFVFWGVGIRILTAGLRQAIQPQFTAKDIFGITDQRPLLVVRELGFANISIGILGTCSLFDGAWLYPAAITGGLFYGLAASQHLLNKERNSLENLVTASDLFMFVVLLIFVAKTMF